MKKRSMAEIKRLIQYGAVKVNNKKEFDEKRIIKGGEIIQVGKREFLKICTTKES